MPVVSQALLQVLEPLSGLVHSAGGMDMRELFCLQIKYPIKKEASVLESPSNALPKYGFMPAEIAAKAAAPSPTPAFWPEVCPGATCISTFLDDPWQQLTIFTMASWREAAF